MFGFSRKKNAVGTKIPRISNPSQIKPPRQPKLVIISPIIGLKIVPPNAETPSAIPITVPNFSLNQLPNKTGIDRVIAMGWQIPIMIQAM